MTKDPITKITGGRRRSHRQCIMATGVVGRRSITPPTSTDARHGSHGAPTFNSGILTQGTLHCGTMAQLPQMGHGQSVDGGSLGSRNKNYYERATVFLTGLEE